MKINILTTATALSDQDLLARLSVLAGKEREATVDLVAHLAALDARPPVYNAEGYSSLFTYCTGALHLSEDAACNRIEAARACRRFPAILDLLAAGSLTLTAVRLLARHLTPENHEEVLDSGQGTQPAGDRDPGGRAGPAARCAHVGAEAARARSTLAPPPVPATPSAPPEPVPAIAPSPVAVRPAPRPVIQATAPERYRVQFTIGQESHDRLRRLQALLRREIPDGDPGAIFDRALALLLDEVERAKLGKAAKPRREPSIRPGTDNDCPDAAAVPLHTASGPAGGLGAGWRPMRLRVPGRACAARSACSWSSITYGPTRRAERPRSRTSPSGAARTTSMKPRWSSAPGPRPTAFAGRRPDRPVPRMPAQV